MMVMTDRAACTIKHKGRRSEDRRMDTTDRCTLPANAISNISNNFIRNENLGERRGTNMILPGN